MKAAQILAGVAAAVALAEAFAAWFSPANVLSVAALAALCR
jgi:hypothetical protein